MTYRNRIIAATAASAVVVSTWLAISPVPNTQQMQSIVETHTGRHSDQQIGNDFTCWYEVNDAMPTGEEMLCSSDGE